MRNSTDIRDVFRSVAGDAVNNPAEAGGGDGWLLLLIVLGIGLSVGAFFGTRRYVAYRRSIAYQRRRLERSVAVELGLSRDQHRDLRRLARQRGVANPLTLLLCPSLLKRSLRHADDAERQVVERLLAKAG